MLKLKSFPSSFTSVSFSKKKKEKKILLKLRATYFPRQTCNFYPNNFTFFPSLLFLFPCATEWQSTFLKVGGLELFDERLVVESSRGERRERKNTRLLCWIAIGKKRDGDRLERLESSRSSRLSFSPPHLFTKFFFHLAVEGRRKSNTRWISYSLRGHSRRFLDFSNYFRFLGNVCWTKGRVSKHSFNSSIFILRFDRLPFRIIHIWRSFILKYSLILGEKFFSV